MAQTVTLQLPDNVYYHAKRTAEATQKAIEEVLINRLSTTAPPLVDEMKCPFKEELRELERMSDNELIELTKNELSITQQKKYAQLLRKNSRGTITAKEEQELDALQTKADRLMLKRAREKNGKKAKWLKGKGANITQHASRRQYAKTDIWNTIGQL